MMESTQYGEELTITRTFDAPRERVWRAWTDCEHFKHWWGPQGYTVPHCEIDLRVGGKLLASMKSPEGREYWSTGVYREIIPMERIVATDSFADEKGNVVPASHYGMSDDFPLELLITITFEEEDGKTKLTIHHVGFPSSDIESARAGWNESFDKLAESLKEETATGGTEFIAGPGRHDVILRRVFDAPRDRVFKMYTDPGRITEWWGPKSLTTQVDRMEVKSGGAWRIVQHDADGNEYAFKGIYHDVTPPERIINTFEWEGMPGHVMLETITVEDLGDKTRVTDLIVFQTVEDRDAAVSTGMESGAVESMENFAALLAREGKMRSAA